MTNENANSNKNKGPSNNAVSSPMTQDLPQGQIGSLLKAYREKKKMSLQQIAEKTKINYSLLQKLEENNLKNLPNKTYLRGFIKAYARVVGLNIEEALKNFDQSYNLFKQESGEETDKGQILLNLDNRGEIPRPKEMESAASYFAGGIFKFLVIIAFLIGFFIFLMRTQLPGQDANQMQNKNQTLNKEKPPGSAAVPPATPSRSIASAPLPTNLKEIITPNLKLKQEQGAESTPQTFWGNNQSPKTEPFDKNEKDNEKTKEGIEVTPNLVPSTENTNINFRKIYGQLYTLNKNHPDLKDAALFPTQIKSRFQSGSENVYVHATAGQTWITYKVDQDKVHSYSLQEGQELFLQGKVIRIFIGNVHATKIIYNNQLVEAASPTGVKSLIFPASVSSQYFYPLFVYEKDGSILTSDEYVQLKKTTAPTPQPEILRE